MNSNLQAEKKHLAFPIALGIVSAFAIVYLCFADKSIEVSKKFAKNLMKGSKSLWNNIPEIQEDVAELTGKIVNATAEGLQGLKITEQDIKEAIAQAK